MLLSLRLPNYKVSHRHLNTLPGPFFKTYDTTSAPVLVLQPRDCLLHTGDPFMPYRSITIRFQALLTSLLGVLFSFRSPYYFAIGLKTCLVLEVGASQIPARYPTHGTQEHISNPSFCVYVTITLYGLTFQKSLTSIE